MWTTFLLWVLCKRRAVTTRFVQMRRKIPNVSSLTSVPVLLLSGIRGFTDAATAVCQVQLQHTAACQGEGQAKTAGKERVTRNTARVI